MTGATLTTNLGAGNVIILSTNGTTGTLGDVNVNDVVSWSANKLTLSAQNNININANLNGSGTAILRNTRRVRILLASHQPCFSMDKVHRVAPLLATT